MIYLYTILITILIINVSILYQQYDYHYYYYYYYYQVNGKGNKGKTTVLEAKKDVLDNKGKRFFDIRTMKLKELNDNIINDISQKAISGNVYDDTLLLLLILIINLFY